MKIFGKKKEGNTQTNSNPVEIIDQLFERRKLDPQGKSILAIAFLYDQIPAPMVAIGSNTSVKLAEDQQIRYILTKILPGYQPYILPGHLGISSETLITSRQFQNNESLDINHINPLLAQMLVDILKQHKRLNRIDLSSCSAISISGNSVATGEARIALLVQ